MKNKKSFTMIELLISLSIFAVIMITLLTAFRTGIFGLNRMQESIEASEYGFIALSHINKDLRNSFVYSKEDSKFKGEKDSLSFMTLSPNYSFVNYYLSGNELLRLIRSGQEALKSGSGIKPRVVAKRIKRIEFTYFSSDPDTKQLKETNAWEEPSFMPAAVRIILIPEKTEEAGFTRTIYLPLGK